MLHKISFGYGIPKQQRVENIKHRLDELLENRDGSLGILVKPSQGSSSKMNGWLVDLPDFFRGGTNLDANIVRAKNNKDKITTVVGVCKNIEDIKKSMASKLCLRDKLYTTTYTAGGEEIVKTVACI